jgi:hypothetical protein
MIFVHGVNVRRGKSQKDAADFDERVKARDELFRSVSLGYLARDPTKLRIGNPYWGDLGASFRYDLVSVPARDTEAFGSADGELLADVFFDTIPADVAQRAQDQQQTESKLLLTLARERSIAHAVDAVIAAAAVSGVDDLGTKLGGAEDLAAFAANAATYVASQPDDAWLTKPDPGTKRPLETDDQFLEVLVERITAYAKANSTHETFGAMKIGERLKAAGRALGRAAKKVGSVVANTVKGTGVAAGGSCSAAWSVVRPMWRRRPRHSRYARTPRAEAEFSSVTPSRIWHVAPRFRRSCLVRSWRATARGRRTTRRLSSSHTAWAGTSSTICLRARSRTS